MFELEQRLFISHQDAYSGVLTPASPCLLDTDEVTSAARQPQELDLPLRRFCANTTRAAPQSQTQCHRDLPLEPGSDLPMTVNRPKRIPERSFSLSQPHDIALPEIRCCAYATISFPQSHKQFQRDRFRAPGSAKEQAVSFPNLSPAKFLGGGIESINLGMSR